MHEKNDFVVVRIAILSHLVRNNRGTARLRTS